jgi:hypothetical protein
VETLLAPAKSIRRIILVMPGGETRTVYRKPKSKRKSSRGMKRLEKAQRQLVMAMQTGNTEYLRRHEKSARKRKDGWVADFLYNSGRAGEKAAKKLRRIRAF